jgi:hypothetical protein
MHSHPDLILEAKRIAKKFTFVGEDYEATPYGNGHINDTFLIESYSAYQPTGYILQRINPHVFKQPYKVMENIERVLTHWHSTLHRQNIKDAHRRCMKLVNTRDEQIFFADDGGYVWRAFHFIDNTYSIDLIEHPKHAFVAASAFGQLQNDLMDLPIDVLHETIPNFHNTPNRFATLLRAIEEDVCNRVKQVQAEIEYVFARQADTGYLLDLHAKGDLPTRVTHNDTKINNVLFDKHTHEPLGVVDLDTVMPGLVAYDFGDMVRTAATTVIEDEPNVELVDIRMDLFEALAVGYLSTAGDILSQTEKETLAFGGKLITLEQGIRFLTDYLQGDVYYKTKYATHNLDRARNQFALVQAIERNMDAMQTLFS